MFRTKSIFICLLFIVSISRSDFGIIFKSGFTASNEYFIDYDQNTHHKFGTLVGLEKSIFRYNYFFNSFGINYEQKGSEKNNYVNNLHYIACPLTFSIKYPIKKIIPYFGLAPRLDFLISGPGYLKPNMPDSILNSDLTLEDLQNDSALINDFVEFNDNRPLFRDYEKYVFGYNIMAGIKYRFKSIKLIFEFIYSRDLTKSKKEKIFESDFGVILPQIIIVENAKGKNEAIQFIGGVEF